MGKAITPAAAGMREGAVEEFLRSLQKNGCNMHDVLMMRGENVFFEKAWAPFSLDENHRMYSVTKSFVSVAIGCLADEGKISLDDPIIRYFPDKLPQTVHPLLEKQTIRHMLMMATCFMGGNWFKPGITDRTAFYFSQPVEKPSGALFDYDSNGSYILGVLVERVSGMPLLAYLRQKVLNRLGGFESAEILETPDGTPWADSGLLCTPRALARFARFVMARGVWNGERLLSEEYLRLATTFQIDNNPEGRVDYNRWGYGYQFWMTERGGFACLGMGSQYAICVPDRDFIFVCNADTQLSEPLMAHEIFRAVFDILVDGLSGGAPAPEVKIASEVACARGEAASPFAKAIAGKTFACRENRMGIRRFRLEFSGGAGEFIYENAQGEKRLPFGMGKNWYGPFPQAGYSDGRGNVHVVNDFRYRCSSSAGWVEEKKLQLRVQVIDRYFGTLVITFGFTGEDTAGVCMHRCAEDFFSEYEGNLIAVREA